MTFVHWILSIPSPSFNSIDLGPLSLRMYGLSIGLGMIAATFIARPRAKERGMHPDMPIELLMWVVPAGIVGARLYHVATDTVPIADWVKIWEGGLGIPGAIAGGAVGALFFVRQRGFDRARLLDAVVPGLPVAQAIGRIGNWWNQELYGRPTDLPWGLEIDPEHRLAGYGDVETFHPTFLYEMIWNLGLFAVLLFIDRKRILRPGKLIWVYTGGYAIGRLWIEAIRIDPATEIAGVRVNIWMMSAVLLFSVAMLVNGFRRGGHVADDHGRSAQMVPSGSDEEE